MFATLHEAGHHVFQVCPEAVNIDVTLNEEVFADEFAWRTFEQTSSPEMLAVDAVRILHAYTIADANLFPGGLQCRLSGFVNELTYPEADFFILDSTHRQQAPPIAANLANLIPVYQSRYTVERCTEN